MSDEFAIVTRYVLRYAEGPYRGFYRAKGWYHPVAELKAARLFYRKADAQRWVGEGRGLYEVVPVTVTIEPQTKGGE